MTKIIDNYHFFWKARSPLTNWWKEDYTVTKTVEVGAVGKFEITFNCSEQNMMFEKAILFGDTETADKILKAKHPSEQKALGRQVKNFDNKIWEEKREEIVYQVLKDKFLNSSQSTKNYLKNTAPKIIVEASKDLIWGCGLFEDDIKITDENNWTGLNLLGKLLTKLRIELYGN